MKSPWFTSIVNNILYGLWSLPYCILGPILAILIYIATWGKIQFRINYGVIEVIVKGWIGKKFYKSGWAAFGGFGWTHFYWTLNSYTLRNRKHERVHTRQVLTYGPLFPFIYLYYLAMVGYMDHPMEREASQAE